jgi:cytosine/adenosine deaminase-related metal-dependent hydrolase
MPNAGTIIRNATLLCLSDEHPDPLLADILIQDGLIAAIGEIAAIDDHEEFDATGCLVMPGLVNAHMHCWQTAMRGMATDLTLPGYLGLIHGTMAPRMTATDMAAAGLAAALNQLAAGTTTVADWCHNIPTPEHANAAIQGLQDAGIRAVFLHGFPHKARDGSPADITTLCHDRSVLTHLQDGQLKAGGDLVRLGMAILGPHYSTVEAATADLELAHELGVIVSMHHSGGPARSQDGWTKVTERGLLDQSINIVHGNAFSDDQLRQLVDLGVTFTSTPEVEMSAGHGEPITDRLLTLGSGPSLGVDIESGISAEMLTVARFALAQQRAADHRTARASGHPFATQNRTTARDALLWATVRGAEALGLQKSVGRLRRGMAADLIVIAAHHLNLAGGGDPYATVLCAGSTNIEAVMVAGEWRKRDGKLVDADIDAIAHQLFELRQRLELLR